MDPAAVIKSEWDVLRKSNTVRGLIAMEVAAVTLFVQQVISGQQPITLDALKGWLLLQGALVLAFLFRHAFAGVEVQLAGEVPPEIVQAIEAGAEAKVVSVLQAGGHAEAAKAVQDALAKGV